MAPQIKLTYFNVEGLAEATRLALVLNNAEFEDDRFEFSEWPKLKSNFKFGQVPVMTVDGTTLAQSGAMLRYVGQTFNGGKLYPQSGPQLLKIEEALGLVDDWMKEGFAIMGLVRRPTTFGHSADWPTTDEGKAAISRVRDTFIKEQLPKFAGFFSKMIEENGGQFVCGETVTIADCSLLSLVRKFKTGFIEGIPKDSLDEFKPISDWYTRMMDLPEIKEWYAKH